MLMKIRPRAIAYATRKKKKNTRERRTSFKKEKTIELKENQTETDVTNIGEQNKELVLLREKTMEGVLSRSKAR